MMGRATKPSHRPPRRGSPTARRRALAAALLMASSAAESPASFLDGRYDPSPGSAAEVDALAALDMDLRSIGARLASGTEAGMEEAKEVYTGGRYNDGATDKVTLQGLSTRVEDVISVGSPTFAAFRDYFGTEYYAEQWIQSSFAGIETEFVKGNYDFKEFGLEGRGAAIIYGTLALNVWMSVVGRLEGAANLCVTIADEDDTLVDEWDQAVALYTGSLSRNGGSSGYMMYTHVQLECAEFGTCSPGEMAPVNDRIFDAFNDGKAHLQQGNCNDVDEKVNDIRSLMTVPLIQSALRAMHALDNYGQVHEDAQGRGAAFSAALLPLVHACSPGNAQILHNDLAPGKILTGDYDVVKGALERSYECLGVTCADVGGILSSRKDGYASGAEACGNVQPVDTYVDYDDTTTSGMNSANEGLDDTTTWGTTSADEVDDMFLYEDYAYFEGKGAPMDPVSAALISGLSFGTFGFIIGAAITCACKARKKKKKEHSEVEFVASRNGNGTANGTGNGGVDEDEVI